jgi:phage gp29-like protein
MSKKQFIEPILKQEIGMHHPARSVGEILSILALAEQGDITAQAELFADMEERDAHIYAEMNKRKMAVAQLDWELKAPAEAAAREKKEIAKLQELIRENIDIESLLFDMADGIGHGYSGVQLGWVRNAQGMWLPSELDHRPARWFTVDNETRQEIRLRDGRSMNGTELIRHGWVMHKHSSKSGEAATRGLFRALALPYLFKNFATKNWLRFCENYGVPIRVLFHSEKDPSRKRELLRALKDMGATGAALLEGASDEDLKVVDLASGEGQGFQSLIDWCERSISKAILGGTLTSDTGTNGNYATANVHNDVRLQLRNHDSRQLAESITRQFLGSIIELNGLSIRPRFILDTQDPEDLALYAEAIPKLVAVNFKVPAKWAHEKLKIPEPGEGEEFLQPLQTQQEPEQEDGNTKPKQSDLSFKVNAVRPVFTQQQQRIESLADALLENLRSPIDTASIAGAIRGAKDPEDLEDRLAAVLGGADIEGFAVILERALFAADVMGYAHAEGK